MSLGVPGQVAQHRSAHESPAPGVQRQGAWAESDGRGQHRSDEASGVPDRVHQACVAGPQRLAAPGRVGGQVGAVGRGQPGGQRVHRVAARPGATHVPQGVQQRGLQRVHPVRHAQLATGHGAAQGVPEHDAPPVEGVAHPEGRTPVCDGRHPVRRPERACHQGVQCSQGWAACAGGDQVDELAARAEPVTPAQGPQGLGDPHRGRRILHEDRGEPGDPLAHLTWVVPPGQAPLKAPSTGADQDRLLDLRAAP